MIPYLFWLAQVIWVFHFVLRPTVFTFAWFRRLYTRCTKKADRTW